MFADGSVQNRQPTPRSPLVPARISPHRDLWLAIKKLAEKLHDLRITGEFLEGFGALPFVNAQEVPAVHGVEESLVRDVACGLRHVLCRAGNLVMQHLGTLRI